MTLEELVATLGTIRDDWVIFAVEEGDLTCSTEVVAMPEPKGNWRTVDPATGMRYVLEVDIAKQVIEVWKKWGGGSSSKEYCAAVVHYASHDDYLDPPPKISDSAVG